MRIQLWGLLISLVLLLSGCSHHSSAPTGRLSDSLLVVANLNDQLQRWQGTPYRHGGMEKSGIDCSGFIYRTFYEQFAITLPRSTAQQMQQGSPVDRDQLQPGDLLFFRTSSGLNGLHVGVYYSNQQFIHASTRVGVTRSSLNNFYWKKTYLQARRI